MKHLKIKLLIVLGVLALIAFGGLAYYFAIYTKTPEYSVKMIERSIERHDVKKFREYVDLDSIADSSYDEFMTGLTDTQTPLGDEATAAIKELGRMLKKPLIASFEKAVDEYVKTGDWESDDGDEDAIDSGEVIARSGIKNASFRGIDSIAVDKEAGTATAYARIFQAEANDEFVLEVRFQKENNGIWRAKEIANVHDFIVFVSRAKRNKITKYLDETAAIAATHDKTMRDADFEFQKILASGSLGKDATRLELKKLMENTVKKDWQTRRDELAAVNVPDAAQSLQRLRLRICDLHIAYADGYANWMTDKKASTIRDADAQLKQAKTLEEEARFLTSRMASGEDRR